MHLGYPVGSGKVASDARASIVICGGGGVV